MKTTLKLKRIPRVWLITTMTTPRGLASPLWVRVTRKHAGSKARRVLLVHVLLSIESITHVAVRQLVAVHIVKSFLV